MSSMTYAGRLYYDDSNEYVDILSFVLRESDIGFSLASVTEEHGRWSVSGTATIESEGTFAARGLVAQKLGALCDEAWDIVFRLSSAEEGLLSVEGELTEGMHAFHFEGELETVAGT